MVWPINAIGVPRGPKAQAGGEHEANLKNIFVSPYPTLFLRYGSVGRKIIFYNYLTIYKNKFFLKVNSTFYIGQFSLTVCNEIKKKKKNLTEN